MITLAEGLARAATRPGPRRWAGPGVTPRIGPAELVQGAKPDEAVTGAHVEQRVAGLELGLVQDLITPRVERPGQHPLPERHVAAVTYVQRPPGPPVILACHICHGARSA